jgi:enoyl-CoA hydratase
VTDDVLISTQDRVGRIRLNRPKAIHALNTAMCDAMSEALLRWRRDDSVEAVIIDHAEGRGFCAGGDVVMIARSGNEDAADAKRFFFAEYRLNHLLFTYPKPTVAIMDGITMGGGVGISTLEAAGTCHACRDGSASSWRSPGLGSTAPSVTIWASPLTMSNRPHCSI